MVHKPTIDQMLARWREWLDGDERRVFEVRWIRIGWMGIYFAPDGLHGAGVPAWESVTGPDLAAVLYDITDHAVTAQVGL